MAFIPAVDTARVAMHFTQDLQQVENVFYVQSIAGWDAASLSTLAGIVKAWWNTSIKPTTSNTVSLNEIDCKDMSSSSGVEIVYSTGLPLVGSSGSPANPNSVTFAIKLVTGLGGRSFRGRQYIIGLTQGNLNADANTVTSAAMAIYTTGYNALITSLAAAYTPGMVIASFHSGGAPRITATLTAVTAALFADNVVDSQRRRLPGRGR